MNFPEKLKKGDVVAIVAPSSPVSEKRALECKSLMESMGYKVKMGQSVFSSYGGYMAGNEEMRAIDINQMFKDETVKAIFCIRGGFSSSRIMEKIDYEAVRRNPKIFVGYSDITNLNIAFNQMCDLITFHGPMVSSNMLDKYDDFTKNSLRDALSMEKSLDLKNPEGDGFKVLFKGKGEGIIVGGNLSLIVSTIGTPYEIDTKGKILFIEEVEETVPRIDRMMHQLKFSKKLEDSNGIILGDFTDCKNTNDEKYGYVQLLKDVIGTVNKPVMYNIKSGHCYPMSTIPLGARCVMNTYESSIKFFR